MEGRDAAGEGRPRDAAGEGWCKGGMLQGSLMSRPRDAAGELDEQAKGCCKGVIMTCLKAVASALSSWCSSASRTWLL